MRSLTHDNMKLHPALYIPWVASVYLRVCFHRGGAKGLDSLWGTIPGPWGRGRFPLQSLLPLSGAFVQSSTSFFAAVFFAACYNIVLQRCV